MEQILMLYNQAANQSISCSAEESEDKTCHAFSNSILQNLSEWTVSDIQVKLFLT